MSSGSIKAQKLIQDLTLFYVKQNYENYLKENNIKKIEESNIEKVITGLYTERKKHLKKFIIDSMKEIMKDDYCGDLFIGNILTDVFSDDQLCKNRIILEIKEYQKNI